jgi:preprotein translocase subunit SecG
MLLGLLLVIQIVVCVALVGVILLQRSEGGALGMGGGPTGFMTARGAGDLLTRTTAILGAVFFILSITLTVVAGHSSRSGSVVDRLKVDALNPDALKPAAPAPATPEGPAPGVFSAPQPQVNTAPAAPGAPGAPPAPQVFGIPTAPQAPQPAPAR